MKWSAKIPQLEGDGTRLEDRHCCVPCYPAGPWFSWEGPGGLIGEHQLCLQPPPPLRSCVSMLCAAACLCSAHLYVVCRPCLHVPSSGRFSFICWAGGKGLCCFRKGVSCAQTVVSSAEHILSTLWNPWTLFFPATYVLWSLTPNLPSLRDVITISETLLPIILPGSSPYSISPLSTFKYNLSSFFNKWTYPSHVTLSDVLIILPEIIIL